LPGASEAAALAFVIQSGNKQQSKLAESGWGIAMDVAFDLSRGIRASKANTTGEPVGRGDLRPVGFGPAHYNAGGPTKECARADRDDQARDDIKSRQASGQKGLATFLSSSSYSAAGTLPGIGWQQRRLEIPWRKDGQQSNPSKGQT